MNHTKGKILLTLNICIIVGIYNIIIPSISNATNITNEIMNSTNTTLEYYIGEPRTRSLSDNNMEIDDLKGKEFFIKNAYTGQYLDVSGGIAANGTNVQQYKYNGTDSQRWYLKYNGDATFSIYTRLGNDGTYKYALDISSASSENYANVQIYTINGSNAQNFQIGCNSDSTVVLFTVVSNSTKAVVLNGPTCDQGRNVDQYTYQGHVNEQWILEPVNRSTNLGIYYARKNVNNFVSAYPNVSNLGGDCANFVSQCMLSTGVHFQNDWYTYRKNGNYSSPSNVDQLNNSWELADPSPWISAKQFSKYWKEHSTYHYYKGSEIVANPSLAWNLSIVKGDVIQIANSTLGILGDAQHTMYITDYRDSTYLLTYHSSSTLEKSLIQICEENPNSYFIFYEIM